MKLLIALFISINCFANYLAPQLIARANKVDSYNLPPKSFFNYAYPVINNDRDLYIMLDTFRGQSRAVQWYFNYKDPKKLDRRPVHFSKVVDQVTSCGRAV